MLAGVLAEVKAAHDASTDSPQTLLQRELDKLVTGSFVISTTGPAAQAAHPPRAPTRQTHSIPFTPRRELVSRLRGGCGRRWSGGWGARR